MIGRFMVFVLLGVAGMAPSVHASDPARCQVTILNRGTAYFSAIVDVTGRCARRMVRTGDFSESCPNTSDTERIETLTADVREAITNACDPDPQTLNCVESLADEGFAVPLGVTTFNPVEPLRGPALRCVDTIARQTARLATSDARQLAACNEKLARGVAGYGPTGPTCNGPSGTQSKIATAHARTAMKLARACGGPDGVVGSSDDPDPQADLGYSATCANHPYCEFAIDTVPDLLACADCIAREEVGQVSRGLTALPLDAATACTVGIGHSALTLLDDDLRDLSACEDRILDGHEPGPCPNTETTEDFALNDARYDARVVAACGAPGGPSAGTFAALASELTDALYPAHAEETVSAVKRCKVEIGRSATSSVGYARRKLRALKVCHQQQLCGQTSAPCPDSEATATILREAADTTADIHTRCDAFTPADLGYGPTCPSSGACAALPTTTITEVIACVQCVADEVVDSAVASVF